MDKIKGFFIAIFSFLTGIFGALAIPILMLLGCNIIDYITGLIAASSRNQEINSKKGYHGIAKKVCMYLLILVGAFVDILIKYAVDNTGIDIGQKFVVAIVVAVWLVANEIISILENMIDIGIEMPAFLLPLVKNIKKKLDEETIKVEEERGDSDENLS